MLMPLPRSLIRKYGISSKAWNIFKRSKSHPRKVTKRTKIIRKRMVDVPRRRVVYRYPRKKKSFRRKFSGLKPSGLMMGTAVVAVAEPMLDAFLDQFGGQLSIGVDVKDVAKVGLGFFLMKRKGFMKGAGYALTVIGVRNLIRGFVGTKIGTSATAGWC